MIGDKTRPGDRLTERQQQLLDFIVSYYVARGVPPTVCEMSEAMNLGHDNAAASRLTSLIRKGAVLSPRTKTARAYVPAGYAVVPRAEIERLRRLEAP